MRESRSNREGVGSDLRADVERGAPLSKSHLAFTCVWASLAIALVACGSNDADDTGASPGDASVAVDGSQSDASSADASRDGSHASDQDADADADANGAIGDAAIDAPPRTTPLLPLLDGAAFYPRAILTTSGHILASVVAPQTGGRLGGTLLRSDDDGVTFTVQGHVDDALAAGGLCCATLYELPHSLGALPAGALLWAASTGGDTPSQPMSIPVWSSVDEGKTWSRLSTAVVAAVPRSSGGLWEPEFSMLDDGTLVCHFSDETQSGHSQLLAEVRTHDGVTWDSRTSTVALSAAGARPGMANVRRGPGGRYFMSYEVCGTPTESCAAHLRTSTDGWTWGDATDIGLLPKTTDGHELRHAPTLSYDSTIGPQGHLYMIGQMTYDGAGNVASENGQIMLANANAGTATWNEIAAPASITAPYDNYCPNYSSTILPLDHGTAALEIASQYDGAQCRSYYARGPL